jgi:hypothetical protein
MAALGGLSADTEVNNGGNGGGFSILADDDYQLEIIESDVKANSKGTGTNVELKVQVADGPNKGQWFFHSITSIQHTSAQAQAIGQGQLKALFEATGGEGRLRLPVPRARRNEQAPIPPVLGARRARRVFQQ